MTIQEVQSLCDALGLENIRVRGHWVAAACPLHSESTPSFGVNAANDEHFYHCFGCHAKGSLLDLVKRVKEMNDKDAKRFIRRFGSYETYDNPETILPLLRGKHRVAVTREVPTYMFAPYATKKRSARAELILRQRKNPVRLSPCQQRPGFDPEQNRVLYPWFDHVNSGTFYGCTGHLVGGKREGQARLIAYFYLKRSNYLFWPYHRAGFMERAKKAKFLVVVEGETDAHQTAFAARNDFRYLVCALGQSELSKAQEKQITLLGLPVVALGDSDMPGQDLNSKLRAMCLRCMLTCYMHSENPYPQGCKDPGDCTPKQVRRILTCAQSGLLISQLYSRLGMGGRS